MCKTKKSQTATEYIVIVAVVIVIALVLVQVMGGFPGIGSGTSKKVSDYKLASGGKIGIGTYYFNNNSYLASIKNNNYEILTLNNFTVDGTLCTGSNTNLSGTSSTGLPLALNPGQQITIICGSSNFTSTQDSGSTPSVSVTYTDLNGYSYTEILFGSSLSLSGISNSETILNSSNDPFSVVGSSYTFRMTTPNATLRFGSTDILVVSISSPSIGITWDYLGVIGSPLNITDTDPHYYTINSINYTIAFIGNGSRIFSVVVGGNGTPITYNCTGSIPANAQICSGDNLNLTNNTANSVVVSCGTPKCEYTCNSGFIINGSNCVNPITSGLVVYYPFDGNTSDLSGNGNDGTNINSSTYNSSGKVGGAYVFSGANRIVSINNVPISGAASRTVSAWFNPTSSIPAYIPTIVALGANGNSLAYRIMVTTATNEGICPPGNGLSFSGHANDQCGTAGTITRGAWNFMVATYDGTTVKVYINGNAVPDINVAKTLTTTAAPLYVAGDPEGPGGVNYRPFSGSIDEVAVWNRVLNSSEISSLYNSGAGMSLSVNGAYAPSCNAGQTNCNGTISQNCSNGNWVNVGNVSGQCGYSTANVSSLRQGLVTYYPFDGNLFDNSSNGNNGTNINSATYNSSGKVGGAYNFNGVNQRIVSISNVPISGAGNRTMTAWFNPTSANPVYVPTIAALGANGISLAYRIMIAIATGEVPCGTNSIHFSGHGNDQCGTTGTITRGAWNFMAATYDGTTVKVYVNGNAINGVPDINVAKALTTTAAPIYVAGDPEGPGGVNYRPYNGSIDEVAVWNRVLNSSEIKDIYNGGFGISLVQ